MKAIYFDANRFRPAIPFRSWKEAFSYIRENFGEFETFTEKEYSVTLTAGGVSFDIWDEGE